MPQHLSVHCTIEHVRDSDSNKSSDFLLNPVCIMLTYIITVLLCKYLSKYCTNEIKFKLTEINYAQFA